MKSTEKTARGGVTAEVRESQTRAPTILSMEKLYIVKDYTGIQEGECPVILVIHERDIFKFIMQRRNMPDLKVQIFTLGDCVYDSTAESSEETVS